MENGEAPLRIVVVADERTTRRRIVQMLGDLPGIVVVGHSDAEACTLSVVPGLTADVALVEAAAPSDEARPGADVADRFVVRDGRRRHIVPPREILWLASYGNYTRVILASGRHYLHRATITDTARQLAPHGFVRVHRTTVVNAARVVRLRPYGNGQDEARLDSGHRIRVSRSYRVALRERLAASGAMEPARPGRAAPARHLSAPPPRGAGRPGSRTSARTVPSR